MLTGEKCALLNKASTVATWKLLRAIEEGKNSNANRISINETRLGGKCRMECRIGLTLILHFA